MFQKLVSHNSDLESLVRKGYAVSFGEGYLIVRDIPYLDKNNTVCWAAFVCKMVHTDLEHVRQQDHQVYFTGSSPYDTNGEPIQNLRDMPVSLALGTGFSDIIVQRQFSNKPVKEGAFKDFFDKIESYMTIISGPAMANANNITPYTFNADENIKIESVFKVHDTLTSRAGIVDLSNKFKDDVVAVIGLGGTGSYLLDFIIRTHVKKIIAFDFDDFHVHNSFRSPGKFEESEFNKSKSEVYRERYDNFREGLIFHTKKFGADCEDDIANVTFAFVCVDDGESRSEIFDILLRKKIPFIDVGMGLNRKEESLTGMIRTTFYPPENAQEIMDKGLSDFSKAQENLYRENIQIGELNALNAALAIIKYKQYKGFYRVDENIYNALFDISDLKVVTETLE